MDLSSVNSLTPRLDLPADAKGPRPVPEDQKTLIHAVRAINAAGLLGQDNELTFILDRNTRKAVVRIVNRQTHEIVEQIPDEHVLRIAEKLSSA
jgi:uncharacterized FlaG/YvyC family protein